MFEIRKNIMINCNLLMCLIGARSTNPNLDLNKNIKIRIIKPKNKNN